MDELIYKSQVIDAIMGQPPEPHYPSWYVEQIKALTPAQPAQEIIRCNDCLYRRVCAWKHQGAEFCSFGNKGDEADGQA